MKNILQIAVFITLCLSVNLLRAEKDSTVYRLSLQEAQIYALENSYSLKSVNRDLDIAEKKVWETIADGLPQVSASADFNKNLNLPVSLIPAEFFGGTAGDFIPVTFGQKYGSSANLSATQMLFDGSFFVGNSAAKVFVQFTKDQKEKTEIEIRNAVAQSYYLVLVAEENMKTIKENLDITKKTLEETKIFYKNGFKEELDVDQVKLMVKISENRLANAKRQIKIAKTVLKFTMGMNIDNSLELSNNLDKFVTPIRLKTPFQKVNTEIKNHIDYRITETQLKAQQLIIKNEQSKYLPVITAFYNYGKNTSAGTSNIFKPEVPWFKSSIIGIRLSLPVFSGFRNSMIIKQEKLKYRKLKDNQVETEQRLKKDISISFTNLMNAKENYENDVEGLKIARRIYDRTQIKFNEGISNSTELSQNEQQYLNSHAAYINSTLNLLNAKISFDKAIGEL